MKRKPMRTAEVAHNDTDTLRVPPLWHWFNVVPASVEPSRPIRHAGTALVFALAVAFGTDAAVSAASHTAAGWPTDWRTLFGDVYGSGAWMFDHLTAGRVGGIDGPEYAEQMLGQGGAWRCLAGAAASAVGAALGALAFRWAARPQVLNIRHVRGPRLLEGAEAVAEARRWTILKRTGDGQGWPLFSLPLNRSGDLWLPIRVWSKSLLIYGSSGAGKSVVLNDIVRALVDWARPSKRRPSAKALAWDAKGALTAKFYGLPGVAILSPFDARSADAGGLVWDVALDCRGRVEAEALAKVLAHGAGTNGKAGAEADFFEQAAQTVLAAALMTMQAEHGTAWGWDTFAAMFSVARADLLNTLLAAGHAEVDELIGSADAKSASIMAAVANSLAVTRLLAQAWPYDQNRPQAERFSVRAWCADNYNREGGGRGPNVVLCKGDNLPDVMGRIMVAMVNTLALAALMLPKDTQRCIAVIADEIAQLPGRINLPAIIETGREACVWCAVGVQDQAQLVDMYGDQKEKVIASSTAMHLVGRTNMGETRDRISAHIGKRVVAVQPHGLDAGAAMEQSVPVVDPTYLTHGLGEYGAVRENGTVRPKGVRLLVHGLGRDVLRLEWPILPVPQRAPNLVPAAWVLRQTEPPRLDIVPVDTAQAEPAAMAPTTPTPVAPLTDAQQREKVRNAPGMSMDWSTP
jgi:hypothetical protein